MISLVNGGVATYDTPVNKWQATVDGVKYRTDTIDEMLEFVSLTNEDISNLLEYKQQQLKAIENDSINKFI
jgi:hypothetical protein